RSAIARDESVLPLSATTISPTMLCSRRARRAFSMHLAKVSSSLRQGMTTDTSIGSVWRSNCIDSLHHDQITVLNLQKSPSNYKTSLLRARECCSCVSIVDDTYGVFVTCVATSSSIAPS